MKRYKIKRNDTVKVIAGKDKGKTGKVLRFVAKEDRVVVEGVNMVKKAVKKRRQNEQGGIIEVEAPIHISNVSAVNKSGERTKVGYSRDKEQKKVRVARKNGEAL